MASNCLDRTRFKSQYWKKRMPKSLCGKSMLFAQGKSHKLNKHCEISETQS